MIKLKSFASDQHCDQVAITELGSVFSATVVTYYMFVMYHAKLRILSKLLYRRFISVLVVVIVHDTKLDCLIMLIS